LPGAIAAVRWSQFFQESATTPNEFRPAGSVLLIEEYRAQQGVKVCNEDEVLNLGMCMNMPCTLCMHLGGGDNLGYFRYEINAELFVDTQHKPI
jgi:hypothetical protein